MEDIFIQLELMHGTTHWVGWFNVAELVLAEELGWAVHKRWPHTQMRRNKDNRLVLVTQDEKDSR